MMVVAIFLKSKQEGVKSKFFKSRIIFNKIKVYFY
jgi:hypothetical protein